MALGRMLSINGLIDKYTHYVELCDGYNMLKTLEQIYLITCFKFNEKERIRIKELLKQIIPQKKSHYEHITSLGIELLDLLDKYSLLVPKSDSNKPAIFKR